MGTDDRFSEDKNKHIYRVKPCAEDRSKTLSNSDVFETTSITPRKGTKAYSIKYVTKNKCYSVRIKQRQLKVNQVDLHSLIDDLHKQLDDKWKQDSKDHLWRQKYRERAKVYMHDLYEVGRAQFIIDPTDLREAKSVFYKLDDHSAEYVIREVISRIIASISVRDFKLRLRDIICYSTGAS
jgi:predicted RNA-binding protein